MILSKYVRTAAALAFGLTSLAVAASGPASVQLPTGGAYTSGAGNIQTSGNAITINQSTLRGIINWNTFSVSQGASVSFKNGSGATLNRVTGTTPTSILGQMLATGSVYLINPQGILIGHGAIIHTGGDFLATTLNLPDKSFLANKLQFSGDSTATVINLGNIASTGGSIYLVGHTVQNGGSLTAVNGTTGLGAGSKVLITDSADGQKVYVQAPGGDVTNSGFVQAAQVELKSNGGNIYALAGNTGGQINATGTATQDGHIWLVATNGTTHVSGTLSATNVDGTGGAIETSGEHVTTNAAQISTGKGGNWLLDPDDLTIDSNLAGTIQTSLNGNTNVTEQTTASGTGGSGDITVASNIAWTTGASLTLSAYRNIGINNGVTISNTGAGTLTLRADNSSNGTGAVNSNGLVDFSASTGNVAILYDPAGSETTKYTTPVTYNTGTAGTQIKTNSAWTAPANKTVSSQATAYMLVNNVTDLQNVSTNLTGTYGVGADFSASSVANFVPIAHSNSAFTGTFDGQGHTISGLTINDTTDLYVGLFGTASGTLRNLSLTGESVTGSANDAYLGGLAGTASGVVANVTTAGSISELSPQGFAVAGGVIGINSATIFNSSSSATVAVQNTIRDSYAGGLIGINEGSVSQSFATGSVSITAPGAGTFYGFAGGLDGYDLYSSITSSYATGNVNVAAAASGHNASSGGLVGFDTTASITNSYASGGTVTGGAGIYTGGLVGYLNNTTVTSSYATGLVSATTGAFGGGLFGHYVSGAVTTSYWDTQASGQSSVSGNTPPSSGVTGLTTSVLMNGILPTGFSSANWVTLAGSYPLLIWQTKLVSGDVFNGSSALSSVVVDALANGANIGSGTTDSSGFYSFTVPAASLSSLLTYLPGTIKGNTFSDGDGAGQFTGMNIYANTLTLNNRTFSTYSGMLAALNLALGSNTGSNFLFSPNAPNITLASGVNLSLNTQIALSLDQPINASGAVALQSVGSLTQTQPITSTSLSLSGTGSYTLGQANSVGMLAANPGGALSFSNTGDLVIGTAGGLTGATAGGTLAITSTGNLTIASGATVSATGMGDALQLTAGNNFLNLDGSSALSVTGGGRWLVFSTTPANDTRGGLPYDFKQYDYTSGGSPAQSTGDGFIYTIAPTLTLGLVNVTKTYDGTTTAALQASNYTTGGVLDGDTVTLTQPSSGTYSDANAGTSKPVTATGLSLVSATNGAAPVYGYQLSPSVTSNTGVINPATLTYTANASSQGFGASNPVYSGSVSGFVAGETLATATTGSLLFTSPATAISPAGIYAINGSGLTAGNYTFTQAPSNATALTIVNGNVPTPLPANTITIGTNNVIGQQGQLFPTFTSTYSGPALGGVNIASLLAGLSYQITPALNGPGTYQVTASGTPPAGYTFNFVPGTLTLIDSTPTTLPSEASIAVPEIPASLASEFKLDFLAPPNSTGWFKIFVEDKLVDGSHQEKTPGWAGSYFFTSAGGQSVTYSSGVKP